MGIYDQLGGGGIVVVDGSGGVIPDVEIEELPENPCQIKASLEYIHYDRHGGNVGADWTFQVNVNSGSWHSGPRTLHYGETLPIRKVVYDEIITQGCQRTPVITIGIHAREHDWWLFDDIGDTVELTALACESTPNRRRVLVTVLVAEYGWGLFRKLIRQRKNVARLNFLITIETCCVMA